MLEELGGCGPLVHAEVEKGVEEVVDVVVVEMVVVVVDVVVVVEVVVAVVEVVVVGGVFVVIGSVDVVDVVEGFVVGGGVCAVDVVIVVNIFSVVFIIITAVAKWCGGGDGVVVVVGEEMVEVRRTRVL